jgi:rubrerythrin
MERFATQVYRTQRTAFNGGPIDKQLGDASENEREHVNKLHGQIKQLNGNVYPFGWLFQLAGAILGLITRLLGRRTLLTADIFVENRAVKDYNSFIESVSFDENTTGLIRSLISEEEVHINNWKAARESLDKR